MSRGEYRRLQDAGEIRTQAPPLQLKTWKNPHTGERRQVPAGIDPGWAGNPGLARLRTVDSALRDNGLRSGNRELYRAAAAVLRSRPRRLAWLRWLQRVQADPLPRGTSHTLGLIDFAAARRAAPASGVIEVPEALIVGKKPVRYAAQGRALTADDWAGLPGAAAAGRGLLGREGASPGLPARRGGDDGAAGGAQPAPPGRGPGGLRQPAADRADAGPDPRRAVFSD